VRLPAHGRTRAPALTRPRRLHGLDAAGPSRAPAGAAAHARPPQALAALHYLPPYLAAVQARAEALDVATPVVDALRSLLSGSLRFPSLYAPRV
jgi:hypothetical protein